MSFRIFAIFGIIFALSACSIYTQSDIPPQNQPATSTGRVGTGEISTTGPVEYARKRREYAGHIRIGNFFALRNSPEMAIQYYLQVLEKLPTDPHILAKLGDAYVQIEDYTNAYSMYKKIPPATRDIAYSRSMYTALFRDPTQTDRRTQIDAISASADENAYYKIIDTCTAGIHGCIRTIEAYSGTYAPSLVLVDTVKNAPKVSADYMYRNILVAAKLYEAQQYVAAAAVSAEIYEKSPAYRENLKIYGFSLYKSGKYVLAKDILSTYLEIKTTDTDTRLALADIYTRLQEYALSNTYYTSVVLAGYTPKTDIERKMAYNAYMLKDYHSMISILGYLLAERDATENDYMIAGYIALEIGNTDRLSTWMQKGVAIYPQNDAILSLLSAAYRLQGDYIQAATYATQALSINTYNILAHRENAYILRQNGDIAGANTEAQYVLSVTDDAIWKDEMTKLIGEMTSI